jgi:TPR repeat protein
MLFTDADRPDSRITADEAAEIQTWIDGGDVEFGDADLMRYAHAFLTGIGAPRDPGLAMELLTPLLETGNQDALDMALGTLDALDPAFAYQIARDAAAQGDRLAFAHLDRLEAELPLLDMLDLQEEDGGDLSLSGDETGRDLRQMAQAALSGLGAPRRYSDAYFYALLALASGDAGAALIVDELEAMGDRMSDADATQWAETLAAIHDRANTVWFASPASE